MWKHWGLAAALSLSLSGCYQGYMRPEELDQNERGPSACAQSCSELGMTMSAFVLVERSTSGCVCTPKPKAREGSGEGAAPAESKQGESAPEADKAALNSIGPAAAYVLILQQEEEARRQAAQQAQQTK